MKQLLLNFLKIVLGICLILLVLLLAFGVVIFLGWPWWVGFFILLGLVGVGVGLLFLKKLLQRKKEQNFVAQVISQEAVHAAALGDRERKESQELQEKWKEAMDALRNSHLKEKGNPLYILPWYLVMGESGSGKTTSIKSARLSSPFAEVTRASGISGTRNCDWWFFEQAVILDTAGRYAIPVDEGKDKDEWQRFLTQLAKFRKREPLNGLVLTAAADKLLSASAETLEEDGRILRLRITELMRVLGAKFPVYLLVTKCDLVQGMTQFCSRLPEKVLDEAMGALNRTLTPDIDTFLNRTLHAMGERLKSLRLQLLHQPGGKKSDPELLLFPEEFDRLKTGLLAFGKGAFRENPYQETPILRGLYFSSGKQEGAPYSHFLKAMGLINADDVLPGTSKGLFLFDFFSKILPADRALYTPTRYAAQWKRLTRNLGLTAWMAILFALCGLLSFSFVKNLHTLKEISAEFTAVPVLKGDLPSDAALLDRFRQTILKAEERNRNWWVPRFGLTESLSVENRLKETYDDKFRQGVLARFDQEMTTRTSGFSAATPARTLGRYIVHLVRRINLLKARTEEKTLSGLQALPQPGCQGIAGEAGSSLDSELKDRFPDLYLYDLAWRKDSGSAAQEAAVLQAKLRQLLGLAGSDLSWLTVWVNENSGLKGITLADFWGKPVDSASEIGVSPAYTLQGKEVIDRFLAELAAALPDAPMSGRASFSEAYQKAYQDAWDAFAAAFPRGVKRLAGKSDHQAVVAQIAEGEGPYFSFLSRMARELAPYGNSRPLISMVALLESLGAAPKSAEGILEKADQKLQGLRSKTNPKEEGIDPVAAAKAYASLRESLVAAAKREATRKGAFELTAEAFVQAEGDGGTSPLLVADKALQTLRAAFGVSQGSVFSDLLSGSLSLLLDFACNETACHLNKLWEDKVLIPIDGMTDRTQINAKVLGDGGLATALVAGDAAPFIDRSLQKGYFPKTLLGKKIAFQDALFSYLVKGTRAMAAKSQEAPASSSPPPAQTDFSVTVKGMPTDVNPEAGVKPHATKLEVQCGEETARLVNLNYPVKKTFDWRLGACGDTVFTIEVGSLVLTKRYPGVTGFADFLSEFGSGEHRFFPKDFPDRQSDLEKLKITYIQVNYVFDGQQALIDAAKKSKVPASAPAAPATPGIPGGMAQCWAP